MQVDPVGYEDQFNLYAYAGNDPINATDPTGTTCEERRNGTFCRRVQQSTEARNVIDVSNHAPISPARAAAIERQLGWNPSGPSENEVRESIISSDPQAAIGARFANMWAIRNADDEYPDPNAGLNDAKDAYRHAVGAIRLTRALGEQRAERLLDAHERGGRNPRGVRLMDLVNNHNAQVMNRLFPTMPAPELARRMMEAGMLKTSPFWISE